MDKLAYYRKFIVAALGAALAAAVAALTDGVVTGDEWRGVALAGLAAIGVYLVPNEQVPTGSIE